MLHFVTYQVEGLQSSDTKTAEIHMNYKTPFIYDGKIKSIAAEIVDKVGNDDVTLEYTDNTGIAAQKK